MSKKQTSHKQENSQPKLSYPMLYLQAILTITMLVLAVVTIFKQVVLPWFELSLGVTLIVIAINNARFYKRKGGTILYSIIGAILVLLSILNFLGVEF